MTVTMTDDVSLAEYRAAVQRAQLRVDETAGALRQAQQDHSLAERQRNAYSREHRLRTPLAHAGLDRALAGAENEMRRRLLEARQDLCRGAGVDSPGTVLDLAALHVLTTPEFAAHLHRLLDEPSPPTAAPMHDMSDEEFEAGLAPLKARVAETNERLRRAQAAHTDASQALNRLR